MKLKNLRTDFLGKNSIFYEEIDSTQSEVWRLIEGDSTPSGTLVMADIQTNARGTHGRVWHTDEVNNIAFSFFVKMDCNIKELDGITLDIAEIIVGIFKDLYNINLDIKLPNDIVFKGKKIGGILTETKVCQEKVKFLVVGIGINTDKMQFSDDIKNIATSIKIEFGVDVDVKNIVVEICNRFEEKIKNKVLK